MAKKMSRGFTGNIILVFSFLIITLWITVGKSWSLQPCCICTGTCTCENGIFTMDESQGVNHLETCDPQSACEFWCENNQLGGLVNAEGSCYEGTCRGCAFSYILGESDPRLDTLTRFRDEVLAHSKIGSKIISIYYRNEGKMIEVFEDNPDLKKNTKKLIEFIMPAIEKMVE